MNDKAALGNEIDEQLLSCPICFEKYNTDENSPKLLSCFHSFCSQCLKNMAHSATTIVCPICRQTTTLGRRGDIGSLRNNLMTLNLMDIMSKYSDGSNLPTDQWVEDALPSLRSKQKLHIGAGRDEGYSGRITGGGGRGGSGRRGSGGRDGGGSGVGGRDGGGSGGGCPAVENPLQPAAGNPPRQIPRANGPPSPAEDPWLRAIRNGVECVGIFCACASALSLFAVGTGAAAGAALGFIKGVDMGVKEVIRREIVPLALNFSVVFGSLGCYVAGFEGLCCGVGVCAGSAVVMGGCIIARTSVAFAALGARKGIESILASRLVHGICTVGGAISLFFYP